MGVALGCGALEETQPFQRPVPRVILQATKFSPLPAALLEVGIDFQ